ncbi:MAG TPA: CHRD domain-containing protein [Anaeromyxobacter sp.]|nr:CHRD domain-containing protein [Anaeromyxobacter sp.]
MRKTLMALALTLGLGATAAAQETFSAHLEGGDLAGNSIATRATGQANLEVIDGGTAIRFRLNVAGIDNLFMAHIHVAAQGPVADNQPVGPIAFWFVPTTPGAPNSNVAQTTQGNLSAGFVMTNAQVVGPLAFDPTRPDDTGVAGLVKAIRERRATIVVHTSDLNNANNQTPGVAGDSPAGEIRGLIQ